MPVHVESRGGKFVIVENSSGRVVGHSKSRKDAEISASIRNRAIRGELDLTGSKTKEALESTIAWFESQGFDTNKAVDLALTYCGFLRFK